MASEFSFSFKGTIKSEPQIPCNEQRVFYFDSVRVLSLARNEKASLREGDTYKGSDECLNSQNDQQESQMGEQEFIGNKE